MATWMRPVIAQSSIPSARRNVTSPSLSPDGVVIWQLLSSQIWPLSSTRDGQKLRADDEFAIFDREDHWPEKPKYRFGGRGQVS